MAEVKMHYGYSCIHKPSSCDTIDFVYINLMDKGIMILKHQVEVLAYDFKELLRNKENAEYLRYYKLSNKDQSLEKMMTLIGEVITQHDLLSDEFYYKKIKERLKFQNQYSFILDPEMETIYEWMENLR